MIKPWQYGLFCICFILGALLMVQLNTERKIRPSLPTRRLNELSSMLKEQEAKRKRLEDELMRVRNRYSNSVNNTEITKLQTLLGLNAVEGQGLIMTLNDSNRPLLKGEDPADLLVHFDQLETVVNQLWASGAEAISINDERVVIDSGLSCAGTTILLNTRRIAPPYVIKAIGDPIALASGAQDVYRDYLEAYDLRVSISTQDSLVIQPFKGSFHKYYAADSDGSGGGVAG